MDLFKQIYEDEEIKKRYQEVKDYEDRTGGIAYHSLSHVDNVIETTEKVLKDLGYEEEFIESAKIAALLHDTGANEGKEGHPLRGYLFAKDYFSKKHLNIPHQELILDAIKNHSNGFETDNIITLVLIFADKLDVKANRITELGRNAIGNRQYSHIEDITIEIHEKNLTINFITDAFLDRKEVEEYYFTSKIFKSIYAFSSKLGLHPHVLLNGETWNLEIPKVK